MIMSTSSKSIYPNHAFPQTWSALDLADAIPLRLSERVSLGLVEVTSPVAANGPFAMPAARNWRRGYLHAPQLPALIRVR